MPTISEAFQTAVGHHQAGRLAQAAEIYRQILSAQPRNGPALHLLGVVVLQSGEPQRAIELISEAIRRDGTQAVFHSHLGQACRACGRVDDAEASFRRAIALDPNSVDALTSLGELAIGRENWPQAIELCQRALAISPHAPHAMGCLATAYHGNNQLDLAVAHYRRSLELEPGAAEMHFNLGVALESLGHLDDARAEYEQTIVLRPDHVGALVNLGGCRQDRGEDREALECYERAVALQPQFAAAHYNRGTILLRQGNFAAGWGEYEWRHQMRSCPCAQPGVICWDGSELGAEQLLLVHAEQGLGDTLQFIRYVPRLARQHSRLVVRVQAPLVRLLKLSGFDVVGQDTPLAGVACQVPLLNLPGLMDPQLSDIPSLVPYLSASDELVLSWGKRLPAASGWRIGICWQGSVAQANDRGRSIPLIEFEALARVAGVKLISLQKGAGTEQLEAIQERFEIHHLGDDFDQGAGAFLDSAAIIKNLDLVVTADTAIAHLAGGLGAKVWVALRARNDWRWLTERSDTPWYPAMTLFRQVTEGDWGGVFNQMAAALRQLTLDDARRSSLA